MSSVEDIDFRKSVRRADDGNDGKSPHSVEAERGVLGSILLNPGECLDQCDLVFRGQSEVFHDLRHRAIYEAAKHSWDKSRVCDVIAVLEHLRRKNQLDAVGGVAYLASLPDASPSAANLMHYVDIVMEHYALRRMIETCTEYSGRALEIGGVDIESFMNEFERDVMAIGMLRQNARGEGKLGQFLVQHQSKLEEGWRGDGGGLLSGFSELDEQMGGLGSGELVVVAGGPSDGKTAIAGNILANQARQKIPVAFFSMEMPGEQIAARLASEQSGIPLKRARKGLDQEDYDRYATAMKQVSAWPMWLCDESGMTIAQIRSRCRRFKSEHQIRMAVLDFLQLIEPGIRAETRNHAVGHIAKQAKAMAMELQIPVIVLSQLSRDYKKQNRRPTLHDLRESGDVEAAADKILFLYRPKADSNITEIIVGKNRNEAKGRVELQFNAPIFRFEPLQEEPGI